MKYLALLICLIAGTTVFSQTTSDEIFAVVEQMPEYPGGQSKMLEFLSQNISYPKESRKKGEVGMVYVGFVITETGEITSVRTIKGVSTLLDAEAERVIKLMPTWKPGYQDGVPVKVKYVCPINFKLTGLPKKLKTN
ncbi:energy transducer TonB [Pseudochryseolinea flava]|uniref:Energy transducer TonB n=1 Tax=Pseudochryseolinea flava TaxID=2059302 RepID=A0A364Y9V4_9BACT|nr:energy transducer TonB [Pseudochryseolinea flava]RAW02688.1 energy transducer TonB [Pseudochryseolinea flava]